MSAERNSSGCYGLTPEQRQRMPELCPRCGKLRLATHCPVCHWNVLPGQHGWVRTGRWVGMEYGAGYEIVSCPACQQRNGESSGH